MLIDFFLPNEKLHLHSENQSSISKDRPVRAILVFDDFGDSDDSWDSDDSGDSDDSDDSDDSWDSDDSDDSDDSVKRCKTLFFNSETFSNVSGLKM